MLYSTLFGIQNLISVAFLFTKFKFPNKLILVNIYYHYTEKIEHSIHSVTCAKIHTRATTTSGGISSKEGRAIVKDYFNAARK